ncbi:TerB family tellurite resistance protein [Pedobacter sp. HMF7647]|uniref:TerB family tellurite resistance protein n=2 Tax=Hufsiella arboris TaxID=2695275 RepID=A0A7K1Y8Q7_9SPHI|nr:TerB family tellurite resistance protein [Hufsiella arboris]
MKGLWKCLIVVALILNGLLWGVGRANAQSAEIQQLLLNVEKLSQMKNILEDMKKGYQVVSSGYNAVRDISQGNFSLHEVFLDGLMLVSPEVKKYRRVADIARSQKAIVQEYQAAMKAFRLSAVFGSGELSYLSSVYRQLFEGSLRNLDELAMVITSSSLRMSDQERLSAVDRIYAETLDRLTFLRRFNRQVEELRLQRIAANAENSGLRNVLGLSK